MALYIIKARKKHEQCDGYEGEGEGCFSAYYNNHLYNQIENYILLLES